jgi:hypothetical protein
MGMSLGINRGMALNSGGNKGFPVNLYPSDTNALTMRSGSVNVELTDQQDLLMRGFANGIQWRAGNDFARYEGPSSGLLGKYFFGCFIVYSENAANLSMSANVWTEETSGGPLAGGTGQAQGEIILSDQSKLVWATGRCSQSGTPSNFLLGTTTGPADTTRFAAGWHVFIGQVPYIGADMAELVLRRLRTNGSATLFLAGTGSVESHVESRLSGTLIRRSFRAFPIPQITTQPCCFNFHEDFVSGIGQGLATDEIAPDHVFLTTLAANHGWIVGDITASAHGKTTSDIGSVWSTGGDEFVLLGIVNTNRLIIARRTTNVLPTVATYTHVSGAANTANIVAGSVTSRQLYPPFQNYSMSVSRDGSPVAETSGTFPYSHFVRFTESYDVLDRPEVISWYQESADGSTIIPSGKDPSYRVTNVYEFDREGNLSHYRKLSALKSMLFEDTMQFQAGRRTNVTNYYFPDTIAFTHSATSVNYSLIEAADRTSAGGLPSVFIRAAECEPAGDLALRMMAIGSATLAMGFLPELDAEETERRNLCTDLVWEIRGNTDKVYARVADYGNTTISAETEFEAWGYRCIFPNDAARTARYIVRRSSGVAYIFADWHDFAGADQIKIPGDLYGRNYEVYSTRNATVSAGTFGGSVGVAVDATGDYGYIILRVT